MSKPSLREKADMMYEEVDTVLVAKTEDGLRSRTYYNKAEHPEYTIYSEGDTTHGLITFVTYIYNVTGDFPQVNRVGSPINELTRGYDSPYD